MSRFAKVLGVFALGFCELTVGGASENDAAEVVIADELRTAFYEHAPRALATLMSKAVISWCAKFSQNVATTSEANDDLGWLCRGQRLAYFRSVYVNGEKGRHGLVCEANGTTSLKYFGIDLVADLIEGESCVSAEFDGEKYSLYFKDRGVDSDA